MKKKSSKILSLVLGASMIMTLTACGPKVSKTSEAGNKNEKINLSFMNFFVRDSMDGNGKAFVAQLDKFKAKYPNVTIDEESLAPASYETKIKTLAAANEMPDLFYVKGSMVQNFIDNKLINNVDDILATDKEWKNGFVDGAFGDFTVDGKTYGIPISMVSTHTIYYNKKLFADAGVNVFPTDWNGFKEAIAKIKATGVIPIALGNKDKWVAESCILSTLGDRFTGTEWFNGIKDKKGGKFTDPDFVKSLAALQDLSKIGAFNSDLNSIDNNQHQALYMNGKAAMIIEGGWATSQLIDKAPADVLSNTEFALLPAVEGGKGDTMTTSGGSGWAFNINSKLTGAKKDAVIELMKMGTGKEQAKLAVENSSTPAQKAENVDKTKIHPLYAKYIEFISKAKYTPVYDVQLSPPVIEVMNSGLQTLLFNKTSPEDLAKQIQKEYEKSN
ncbi:extracellular solute-binding protein [Clostridium lacusfryxellense]|uniref:extracellular solute-binding protein n=1 Tax=Clostridium lacusfryxellense TaxID=205328 RepID=UPI001C0CA9F3|nr:extracellular solute-binding protein [Clostridium lacusfryxellense]MBU3113275.1 extracellular solute-binding protein [Clostridium lacusfryxellense]